MSTSSQSRPSPPPYHTPTDKTNPPRYRSTHERHHSSVFSLMVSLFLFAHPVKAIASCPRPMVYFPADTPFATSKSSCSGRAARRKPALVADNKQWSVEDLLAI